ncbi:MAG TPA: UMP kinase, partial [Candidatus Woesearchaeota archaeon]|nr:UMP kinase [Candidatus Woesearchaeota archaeon]
IIIPDEINIKFLKDFVNIINKYKTKHRFQIICGGGRTARRYANAAKELKVSDNQAHKIGIAATHLNAKFIATLLKGRFSDKDPREIGKKKGIMVSGGYKVGWTTDTDAAYIAKEMNADLLINLTDVKGVYTKNPKKYKDAKFLPEVSWKEFFKILGTKTVKPGGHYVFDPFASVICQKNKIKVIVASTDLKNLEKIFKNEKFIGTTIR